MTSLPDPRSDHRLGRRGLALLCVAILALSACGGSSSPSVTKPTDPVGGMAAAFDIANAGGTLVKMDLASCLTTGSAVAGNFGGGLFGTLTKDELDKLGITSAAITEAWKVTFDSVSTKEVSRSGDSAIVHVDVKMTTTIDPTKFRELAKKYAATTGVIPDDATIDAAIKAKLGGQYTQSVTVSQDITVVAKSGGWVACGAEFAAPGVGGALASSNLPTPSEFAQTSEPAPSFVPASEIPSANATPGASGSTTIPNVSGSTVAITAGNGFACALISDGSVKCWGKNDKGQLGNGTTTDSAVPVGPSGLGAGVKSISADTFGTYACAVIATGAVKCWGTGPLGNGPSSTSTTPVNVVGISSGARSVAVATSDVCAVMSTGGVKCWGQNDQGQLGNNSTVASDIPVDVAGLGGVAMVAPAGGFACALTTAGAVKCWGYKSGGTLGNGSTSGSLTPVDVVGLDRGVKTVATEGWGSCALTAAGGVKCWGGNNTIPTDVVGLTSGVRDLFGLARLANCASSTDGRVLCWGSDPTPKDAIAQFGGAFARLVFGGNGSGSGANITCVLTTSGGVACFDQNAWTEIGGLTPGSGGTTSGATPGAATGSVTAVTVGSGTSCVLTMSGGIRCWGRNPGNGATTSATPVDVYGLTSGVSSVVTDGLSAWCALTTGGGVKCWGSNSGGELGNGSGVDSTIPVDVTGLGSGVKAIAAGQMQMCALTNGGGLKCWGDNKSKTPADAPGLTTGVAGVSVGSWTYVLTDSRGLKRWAAPISLQDVPGFGSGVKAVDARSECALMLAGGVKCVAATANLSSLSGVMNAISGTCVITATGGVKCWGNNLGNGTTVSSNTPVDAVGLSGGVRAISSGSDGVCAVTADHALMCWGSGGSTIPINTIPTLFPGL